MELAYSHKYGSFPLYAPGFAVGRSQAALTLGQQFHPLFYLASLTPGYWHGNALSLNTLYRLLSLGLCQLILFRLFRKLNLGLVPAFIISFITVYNLRMLDLFRYGAALENYTAYLLLCASMGFYYIRRSRFTGPLSMIASTYLLVCGGHPQMMYFGLLGALIICLAIPFVLSAIQPQLRSSARKIVKFYGISGCCIALGIFLASPYVVSFYDEFLTENTLRVGRSYAWSLAYSDSIGGALNNFFAPLNADVHGAFGSSPLILLPLLMPLVFTGKNRPPFSVLALSAMVVVVFLCSTGSATVLHYWFWRYFPLAQAFRTPGRLTLLLPFVIALSLAWLFRPREKPMVRCVQKTPFSAEALLVLICLGLFVVYNSLLKAFLPAPSHYVPLTISGYGSWVETFVFWCGLISLILLLGYCLSMRWTSSVWRMLFGGLLCMAVTVQVTVEMRYGTWTKTAAPTKTLFQMDMDKRKSLAFGGVPGFGMEYPAVTRQMKRSAIEPQLAKFYQKHILVTSEAQAYHAILKQRTADVIVVEGFQAPLFFHHRSISERDEITLIHATFNRIVFKVFASRRGFFSLAYPYDGRWQARVDGSETAVYRSNGIENAVFLDQGTHLVEFWYRSIATVTGAVVSTATLFLLAVFFYSYTTPGRYRWIGYALIAATSGAVFFGWYGSLYNGENLKTHYHWSSNEFPPSDNLAYAKSTRMSSIWSAQMPYFYYPGLAVDGNKTGRPFVTGRTEKNPWWQVDLGRIESLGEIVITDRGRGRRYLPLEIYLSNTGNSFRILKEVTDRNPSTAWHIPMNGAKTRFVRLQSRAHFPLAFFEVEIFPYGENPEN